MQVTFGVNNQAGYIFQDMPYNEKNTYPSYINKNNSDTFERQSLKNKIKSNKKLIIGGAIIGTAVIGAIVFRKNIAGLIKSVKAPKQTVTEPVKTSGLTEDMINKAKDFLINDVQTTGEATANGICFYGPDSLGKEKAISQFLNDLQTSGYKIEHAPRVNNTPLQEISGHINELIKEAEERFNSSKIRTAIVVRDIDKIASDRRIGNGETSSVVSALLKMQDCRKRGFAWISEAVDVSKVDAAVARMGRMEHKIPIMPLADEPISVWNKYIALIERFKDGVKKDTLLQEAREIISKKGI